MYKQKLIPTINFETEVSIDRDQEIKLPEPEVKVDDTPKIVYIPKPEKPGKQELW